MKSYSKHATFYQTALLLGLVTGESVVAWADHVLVADPDAPPAFVDLSITPPDQLSAMRHVLRRMAEATERPSTVRAVLDLVHRDLASGRRSPADTMRVIAHIRRELPLPVPIESELDTFEDDHMLAVAGVAGATGSLETRLRTWLAQFEGEYETLADGKVPLREVS